jgi:hypothetical protein
MKKSETKSMKKESYSQASANSKNPKMNRKMAMKMAKVKKK